MEDGEDGMDVTEETTEPLQAAHQRENRRLRAIWFEPDVLLKMGQGKFVVTGGQLPEDARIVGAHYDQYRHLFMIVLHSETWDVVPEGERIPEIWELQIAKLPDEPPAPQLWIPGRG